MALFYKRPAGELVTYEELLALFFGVQSLWYALWMAVSWYNRQLEGTEIILIKGRGYVLAEEKECGPVVKGFSCGRLDLWVLGLF